MCLITGWKLNQIDSRSATDLGLVDGVALSEEPQTFVTAVQYLQTAELVDTSRISLLGFSTGASTGLAAASWPEIASGTDCRIRRTARADLSPRVETTYLVTSLFDHVQPKQEITWETLVQGFRLYGFLTEALGYV